MIEGACLCGAVGWRLDRRPESATRCNCTSCRRYGTIVAYGHDGEGVSVTGVTQTYARGDHALDFHFCPSCGCWAYWRARDVDVAGRRRIAVNLRLAAPEAVASIPVRRFDGLDTWDALPSDGRTVADHWF